MKRLSAILITSGIILFILIGFSKCKPATNNLDYGMKSLHDKATSIQMINRANYYNIEQLNNKLDSVIFYLNEKENVKPQE